jgi:peptidyl-prolyl cis-trans isomerase A (cyclophilin A)
LRSSDKKGRTFAPTLTKRLLLAGAGALAATAVVAQGPSATTRVRLNTTLGVITVELAIDKAPITSANFLRYVDEKRLDGADFYRADRIGADGTTGLIQGGLENHPERALAPIAHESTLKSGLSHRDGVISLARFAPGTATCEFFICLGDQTYLDADPKASGDNEGFAAFGRVVEGIDVARKILASHDSATLGEGAMRGQILDPPIPILSARRV